MKRTGAQIIWECLVHEGVKTSFWLPGWGDHTDLRCFAGFSDSPCTGPS